MSRDSKKYPRKGDMFEVSLASNRFRMLIMDADGLTVDALVVPVGSHGEDRRKYSIGFFRVLVDPWTPTYVAPDPKRDPKIEPKHGDVWRRVSMGDEFIVVSVGPHGDVHGLLKNGKRGRDAHIAAKDWLGFIQRAEFQHGPGIPAVAKERDPLRAPVVGDVWKSRTTGRLARIAEVDYRSAKLRSGNGPAFTVPIWSLPGFLYGYDLEIDATKATAKPFEDLPKPKVGIGRDMATDPIRGDRWIGKHGNNEDLEREVKEVDALTNVVYKVYQKDGTVREYRMPLDTFADVCKKWKPIARGDMPKPDERNAREKPAVRDLWVNGRHRREIVAVNDKSVDYIHNGTARFTCAMDQFFEKSQDWGDVTVAERREAEAPKRTVSIEEEAIADPRVGDAWEYNFESGTKGYREITEVKDGRIFWKNPEFGLMIFSSTIEEMRPAFGGWTLNYRARAAGETPKADPAEQQKAKADPAIPERQTFILPVNVVPILFIMQPGIEGKIVAMSEGAAPEIKSFDPRELPADLRAMLLKSLDRRLDEKLKAGDGKAAGEIALSTHSLQMVK